MLTTGGNRRVTINGQNLGSGTDITTVEFGTLVATIVSQSQVAVVVNVPNATPGVVGVTIISTSRGTAGANNVLTFNAPTGM